MSIQAIRVSERCPDEDTPVCFLFVDEKRTIVGRYKNGLFWLDGAPHDPREIDRWWYDESQAVSPESKALVRKSRDLRWVVNAGYVVFFIGLVLRFHLLSPPLNEFVVRLPCYLGLLMLIAGRAELRRVNNDIATRRAASLKGASKPK